MFVSPQNSQTEVPISNVTTFGGGAFGKCLGHEGGVLMNDISALKKETREFLCSFYIVRTQKEDSIP